MATPVGLAIPVARGVTPPFASVTRSNLPPPCSATSAVVPPDSLAILLGLFRPRFTSVIGVTTALARSTRTNLPDVEQLLTVPQSVTRAVVPPDSIAEPWAMNRPFEMVVRAPMARLTRTRELAEVTRDVVPLDSIATSFGFPRPDAMVLAIAMFDRFTRSKRSLSVTRAVVPPDSMASPTGDCRLLGDRTSSVNGVVRLFTPSVAVIVMGVWPRGVAPVVVIARVDVPVGETAEGVNTAVPPAGSALKVRLTGAAAPPVRVTVTTMFRVSPGIIVSVFDAKSLVTLKTRGATLEFVAPPVLANPPVAVAPPKDRVPAVDAMPPVLNVPPALATPPGLVSVPPVAFEPPVEAVPPVLNVPPALATPPGLVSVPPVAFEPPVEAVPPVLNVPPALATPPGLVSVPPVAFEPPVEAVPPVLNVPPALATPPGLVVPPVGEEPPTLVPPPFAPTAQRLLRHSSPWSQVPLP